MTRTEKWIIAITVVVLGVGSIALMWTSRQVGTTPTVSNEPVEVTAPAARTARSDDPPSRPAPPPPAAPPPAQRIIVEQQQPMMPAMPQQVEAQPVQHVAAAPAEPEQPSRREERNEAVRSLQAVEAQLATGNTDGVDEALQTVSGQLDEPARSAVEAARTALENKDLTLTRDGVIRAIAASR